MKTVLETEGDIWKWRDDPHNCEVVIPTNQGWKADGSNVMGAGVAKQAVKLYGREIAEWYGGICQAAGPNTPVVVHPEHPLIFFPVKPLNYDEPHLSWRSKADIRLIDKPACFASSRAVRYPNGGVWKLRPGREGSLPSHPPSISGR